MDDPAQVATEPTGFFILVCPETGPAWGRRQERLEVIKANPPPLASHNRKLLCFWSTHQNEAWKRAHPQRKDLFIHLVNLRGAFPPPYCVVGDGIHTLPGQPMTPSVLVYSGQNIGSRNASVKGKAGRRASFAEDPIVSVREVPSLTPAEAGQLFYKKSDFEEFRAALKERARLMSNGAAPVRNNPFRAVQSNPFVS